MCVSVCVGVYECGHVCLCVVVCASANVYKKTKSNEKYICIKINCIYNACIDTENINQPQKCLNLCTNLAGLVNPRNEAKNRTKQKRI
jgi:hypothetical protein